MKTKVDRKARAKLIRARHKARIKSKRPAHKKVLLHPATVFLLLCLGVLFFGRGLISHADVSYQVLGKVPAAPLTEPATIIHPKDGDKVASTPITVTGTCPTQSYIKLYRNDIFAGTTICTSDNNFTLQVGLVEGSNKLQARVFNITDDEGPLSSPITITYAPPVLPLAVTSSGAPTPKPSIKPFIISSDYSFVGYKVGQNVSWKTNISGGTGPYAINVKWGDGSESNYVQKSDGLLNIEHSYSKTGIYAIKLHAVDSLGGGAFLQLQALVGNGKNPGISGFFTTGSTSSTPKPPTESFLHKWRWVFASSYGLVILMVLSFWLGEQQQYLHALRNGTRGRHMKR